MINRRQIVKLTKQCYRLGIKNYNNKLFTQPFLRVTLNQNWVRLNQTQSDVKAESNVENEVNNTEEAKVNSEETVNNEMENKINELTEQLKERDEKIKNLGNEKLRILAEMENVRRVAREDVDKASKFGVSKFASQLLEVADDMERFMANVNQDQLDAQPDLKTMHEGMVLVNKKLQHIFGTFKIIKFESLNEPANPELHDVLFQLDDPEKEPGTIANIVKEGYMIGDRVLRAAQVGTVKER